MALFQKPARTAEEIERGKPLSIGPAEVELMDEATWYEKVYRGDSLPQLTWRGGADGRRVGLSVGVHQPLHRP